MFAAAIVIGIVVAYLRGGRFKNIEHLEFKLWYLLTAAFLMQFLAINLQFFNDRGFYIFHLLSYVIIMIVPIVNRHLKSMWALAVGNVMNFIVIAFNHGKMPVRISEKIFEATGGNPYFDRGHVLLEDGTRFKVFADLYTLDLPLLPLSVFSLGDVFLVIAAFVLIQEAMVEPINEN